MGANTTIEPQTYDCHGVHDDLPKGKASGKVISNDNGLMFYIGDHRLHAPAERLEISMGGASQRLVFFKHPRLPGWIFYTADRRILKDPFLKNEASLSSLLGKAKRKRAYGWGILAAVLAVIVFIPVFTVFRMDVLTKAAAHQVPSRWEEKLGDSVIAQYKLENPFLDEKKAEALLNPLVSPLLDALPDTRYDYNFYIVNNGTLNAFALPGGEVVIHSALILKADNAEELLGVLAHEIMHVEQQHGVRNVIGAAGIYILAGAVFGDVSGLMATIAGAAPILLNQSYSRKFETESDVLGYDLLRKANIDPSGLASFFNKLIQQEKEMFDKIEDEDTRDIVKGTLAFLSTHPATDDRVAKLNELQAENAESQIYRDFSEEFGHLQDAVKKFVAEEDQKPAPNEDITHEN